MWKTVKGWLKKKPSPIKDCATTSNGSVPEDPANTADDQAVYHYNFKTRRITRVDKSNF